MPTEKIKEINLPLSIKINLNKGENTFNLFDAIGRQNLILQNSQKIISSALAIEKNFELIISHYFFSENQMRRSFFEDIILKSDWCSFSSKRKIIISILNESKLLEGKNKSEFEKLTKNIMQYRNAFTHGELNYFESKVFLKYFSSNSIEEELTNEYWEKLEKDFHNIHEMTNTILLKITKINSLSSE